MTDTRRCAVVGGGIIGAAVARRLTQVLDGAEVTLYEKEPVLGAHQSGHNSGVVHAGLYYQPGSLRARLCLRGKEMLAQYCDERQLPYLEVGKVVVAHTTVEYERLLGILERARANGVPDMRMLDPDGLRGVEQHARGVAALHSPHTAITDYPAITRALGADVQSAGGTLRLATSVTGLRRAGSDEVIVDATPVSTATTDRTATPVSTATADSAAYDLVVVCAGLQSDRLAAAAGDDREPRIVPFFGDYFLLDDPSASLVSGLIYPVPDPAYPFLGVHLTRHVDGSVSVGPNAYLSLGRERYDRGRIDLRDSLDVAGFGGFWRFAARNAKAAVVQGREAVSPAVMVRASQQYVPGVRAADFRRGPRGIRAQAMDRRGTLVDDFAFTRAGRIVNVRNAPSPGATSSLAVAEHVVDLALGND